MNQQFLVLLQKRMGSTSLGPSTARKMGPPGTIQAARSFLASIDLARFEASEESGFLKALNAVTGELQAALPDGARHWGSARKFLNIFLRDCVYNRHLCGRYKLAEIEAWLEVPLDSQVANGLRSRNGRVDLPRWRTVIGLTSEVSDRYQAAAAELAAQLGIHRIHLDLRYWRAKDA